MQRALLMASIGVAGVALGAIGATYVGAQTPQIQRNELLREALSGVEGKELVVFTAELPPGAVAGRHSHPGDEAIYMLEGTLRLEPDGGEPVELKAGEILFNPAGQIHKGVNEGSEAAKVLNCMIAEAGQPLATPAQ